MKMYLCVCLFLVFDCFGGFTRDSKVAEMLANKDATIHFWREQFVANKEVLKRERESFSNRYEKIKMDLEYAQKTNQMLILQIDSLRQKLYPKLKVPKEGLQNLGEDFLSPAEKEILHRSRAKAIALGIMISVLLLAGGYYGYIVLKRRKVAPTPTLKVKDDDDLACPLCGWKHGKEDRVCKNEKCRTRF